MERLSVRKFSVLGMVLATASAVTAAIVPSNVRSNSAADFIGTLTLSVNNIFMLTCKIKIGGSPSPQKCNDTKTGLGVSRNTNAGISISNVTTIGDV